MNEKQIYRRYFDRDEIKEVSESEALRILAPNYPFFSDSNILEELNETFLYTPGAFYSMDKEKIK